MTNEEAIEKVKDMRDYIIRFHSPNDVFISHMNEAIETLKRSTCKTCTMWNDELKYCYRFASFMGAEDYCSEHEEKEGD